MFGRNNMPVPIPAGGRTDVHKEFGSAAALCRPVMQLVLATGARRIDGRKRGCSCGKAISLSAGLVLRRKNEQMVCNRPTTFCVEQERRHDCTKRRRVDLPSVRGVIRLRMMTVYFDALSRSNFSFIASPSRHAAGGRRL